MSSTQHQQSGQRPHTFRRGLVAGLRLLVMKRGLAGSVSCTDRYCKLARNRSPDGQTHQDSTCSWIASRIAILATAGAFVESNSPFASRSIQPLMNQVRLFLSAGVSMLMLLLVACSGSDFGFLQPTPEDLCKCIPIEPDTLDYRHLAKHVPIPNVTPEEIDVSTILGWPEDPVLPPDAPRSGRELQVFHVATAFVQEASVNAVDCDVHLEISETADKNAPRVIVETPVDSEYCSARRTIQAQLKQHNFQLDSQHGGELSTALPAEVLGMAFEDFEHNRGSDRVATVWELHPAIVTLK